MIKDFWVENYLSIRNRQGLSFVTQSEGELLSCEMVDGTKLNKLGVLYGANASGKSNILKAMENLFRLLSYPKSKLDDKVQTGDSFALTRDLPTRMHIAFYALDVLYEYDIEYTIQQILHEELYYYPNGTKELFYDREYVKEGIQANIHFGNSLHLAATTQSMLIGETFNNHTVLSTYAKKSYTQDIEPLANLYLWVMEHVHEINGDRDDSFVREIKGVLENGSRYNFYLQMLKKADINITSFSLSTREVRLSSKIQQEIMEHDDISESEKERLLNREIEEILFRNKSQDGDFDISSNFQSLGTKRYLRVLAFLYDMCLGGHIYLLDELDEFMHYDLLLYYLNVFIYNSEKSQLIFTSHELLLLMEDLLNEHRDCVWFVEKDSQTASSIYTRADLYNLHSQQSLFNAYKIGRLGAKPILGSPFITINNN